MNIEELINKDFVIKIRSNLPIVIYIDINRCGLFKFIGQSRIDTMDMFIITKITKRKIKINKIFNNNIELSKKINTIIKQYPDDLEYIEITDHRVTNNLF